MVQALVIPMGSLCVIDTRADPHSLAIGEGNGFSPVVQFQVVPPGAERGLVLKKLLPHLALLLALSGCGRDFCSRFDPFTIVVLPDTQM